MACTVPHRAVEIEVALDTKDQTRERVKEIVEAILARNNAIECGIMGYFSIRLGEAADHKHLHDPGEELKGKGVRAIKTTELD